MSFTKASLSSLCLAVAITITIPPVIAGEKMPGAPEKPIRPGSDPFGCKKRGGNFGSSCVALASTKENNETPKVVLSPFKIVDNNGSPILTMSRNGRLNQGKKSIGKISRRGNVSNNKGKVVANLSEDGILKVKTGDSVGKIGSDGSIDNGSGVLIHWLEDGTLARGDESLSIKLVPAASPARRAASIAISLYLLVQPPKVEEMPK